MTPAEQRVTSEIATYVCACMDAGVSEHKALFDLALVQGQQIIRQQERIAQLERTASASSAQSPQDGP